MVAFIDPNDFSTPPDPGPCEDSKAEEELAGVDAGVDAGVELEVLSFPWLHAARVRTLRTRRVLTPPLKTLKPRGTFLIFIESLLDEDMVCRTQSRLLEVEGL
jgi:hypothetical protein